MHLRGDKMAKISKGKGRGRHLICLQGRFALRSKPFCRSSSYANWGFDRFCPHRLPARQALSIGITAFAKLDLEPLGLRFVVLH